MNRCSFSDFYEDLQVSSNADQETIERVYRLLAKRYHPDNHNTGKAEKFDVITKAYKNLANPEKRSAYDVNYEKRKSEQLKTIYESRSSEGYDNDRQIRNYILSILYIERRKLPEGSGVGIWQIEKLINWPEKILEFHMWYLKEKGWIERTDTGGYSITALGVDEVEHEGLNLGKDRLLTESTEISENGKDHGIIFSKNISTDTLADFETSENGY